MNDRIKLFFDFQILLMQKYGGISRYFYDLYQDLPKDQFDITLPVLGNKNEYFSKEYPTDTIISKLPRGHWKLNEIYTRFSVDRKSTEPGVLHATYFHPYLLNWYKGKLVVTVYDMIYENFPEFFDDAEVVREQKRMYMERADKIIAISGSTKKDILKWQPQIAEDKISVIYLNTDEEKFKGMPEEDFIKKFSAYPRYVLFVGRRDLYKNFKTFALAMKRLMEKEDDLFLVCAGGGAFTEEEKNIFIGHEDRVCQMYVSDDELGWLYKNAACFVFPSLGEGFGIPVLEAWENDCPVVLSDIDCFREIGGDACRFFDPNSPESIYFEIVNAISNDNEPLKKKGKERLLLFSKQRMIDEHINIYRSLI